MNHAELLKVLNEEEKKRFMNTNNSSKQTPASNSELTVDVGILYGQYQPTEQYETIDTFDDLYISDDLISCRIKWENVEVISVNYYTIKDLGIPWWKFWIDKNDICNRKNKKLWQEAIAVSHIKKLPPVQSPIKYIQG